MELCWQRMPRESDWQARLNAIDWPRFHTIYGAATKTPETIASLHSPDDETAVSAARELHAELCHKQVQIASAALPAFPFLVEVLPSASQRVKIEILDTLVDFAITSDRNRMARFASALGKRRTGSPGWVDELRSELARALPQIAAYVTDEDPSISECAKMFADEMRKGTPPA